MTTEQNQTPVLIRLYDRTQLIGLRVENNGKDFYCFTQILNIIGSRPMKMDKEGLLSDLTEADKTSNVIKAEDRRDVPIMNLPDEAILTSTSVMEALEKVWEFPTTTISALVSLNPESVLGRFYTTTVSELMNNRSVSRRLFRYSDLSNDVARAIYDEDMAKKIFKSEVK